MSIREIRVTLKEALESSGEDVFLILKPQWFGLKGVSITLLEGKKRHSPVALRWGDAYDLTGGHKP